MESKHSIQDQLLIPRKSLDSLDAYAVAAKVANSINTRTGESNLITAIEL